MSELPANPIDMHSDRVRQQEGMLSPTAAIANADRVRQQEGMLSPAAAIANTDRVRQQYEALPYPPVNPQDERVRLLHSWLDHLPMMNHYCYGGRQSFANGFRVLVAGGGTGTSSIFLAEQLRHTDAQIVHLDLSAASIAVAKERAAIRGLTHITWVHDSLLNLPRLGLGAFDYINCIGVLHHLSDPDAGLRALQSVLKPQGALALMVYGQIGRTGIYQMQSLMRAVNGRDLAADGNSELGTGSPLTLADELVNTRQMLSVLPPGNWFKRCEDLWQADMQTDADVVDVVLHSQDRAYTVAQIFEWLVDVHGYSLAFSAPGRGRSAYLPRLVLAPSQLDVLQRIDALPARQQYAIAELLSGKIMMHVMYAVAPSGELAGSACTGGAPASTVPAGSAPVGTAPAGTASTGVASTDAASATTALTAPTASGGAAYGDPDMVPFFYNEPLTGPQLAFMCRQVPGQPVRLGHAHLGLTLLLPNGRFVPQVFDAIDGRRSFAEIFDHVRVVLQVAGVSFAPNNAELFADFQGSYELLNAIERLLLRHCTVPDFPVLN